MRSVGVFSFFVIVTFATTGALACSLAGCLNSGAEMNRDFTVTITHDGKPLAGVDVEIRAIGRTVFSAESGSDGTVHVAQLESGEYWIAARFLGVGAAQGCFHVEKQPTSSAKNALHYEWGDDAPATRRVAGKLVENRPGKGGSPLWNQLHRVDVPVVDAKLTLRSALTSDTFRTSSDTNGEFFMDGVPPGTYVLHVEGGLPAAYGPTTDVVLNVSEHVPHDYMVFKTDEGGGSCGDLDAEFTQRRP